MKLFKKDKRTNLEREIDSVLAIMSVWTPKSKEYTTMVENLEKLYKMKTESRVQKIKPDTIALLAGNLLGIVLILTYERTNVITTKALNFVTKGRV